LKASTRRWRDVRRGEVQRAQGEDRAARRRSPLLPGGSRGRPLKSAVDKARKSADERAAELRAKSKESSDETKRQWLEAQSKWDEHIKHLRTQMDAKKAELDADRAIENAYEDETDAMDAIDYASSAVAEAEYAVLTALRSEKRAEELKHAVQHS